MAKKFKTYDDLLYFLKYDKNLNIEDEEQAKQILKKIGYFSLISGYKEIFKNTVTKKFFAKRIYHIFYL